MRLVLTIALVLSALPLQAGVFGPSNYDACVDDASRRPTGEGVKLAMRQCHERFRAPELRRQAQQAEADAQRVADEWPKLMNRGASVADVRKVMGDPATITHERCAALPNRMPPSTMCRVMMWTDRRAMKLCPGGDSALTCYFRLHAPVGAEDVVWAWWPESH